MEVLKKCLFLVTALFISALAQDRPFPDDFRFGVATSAYQVEGGWDADDKSESIWDRATHTTDIVADGTTGDIACDSFHKIERDIEMLKELGVNYYKFSLSWTRLLPDGFDNNLSSAGVDYYNKLIDLLVENDIEPVVTLFHWDLPQVMQDLGGWTSPEMSNHFVTGLVRLSFIHFGDRVKDWVTFNEPFEICETGYSTIDLAPAINFPGIPVYQCAHQIIKIHARIHEFYRNTFKPIQKGRVGIVLNADWHEPEDSSSEAHIEAAERALQFQLGWFAHPIFSEDGDYPEVMKQRISELSQQQGYSFSRLPQFSQEDLDYIKGSFDFFGINHYTSVVTRPSAADDQFVSPSYTEDVGVVESQPDGWPSSPASTWLKVYPKGFTDLLMWITNEYNSPEIIVFENGYSDLGGIDDTDRINYFTQYLNAMLDAIDKGAKVTAYTAWSLMDNFEWNIGYTTKFGLYDVDFNDPERTRTPKKSATFFKDLIASKTISPTKI